VGLTTLDKETSSEGSSNPGAGFLLAHPAHFVALGFGAGLSRFAPGTVGTLVGFPVFWALSFLPTGLFWIVWGLLAVMGIWICDKTGRDLGVADHGMIVWDEIIAFVPLLAFTSPNIARMSIAFVLFRCFDIWKPFPIKYLDGKLKNGWGVMLDDILAAVYAVLAFIAVRAIANVVVAN
jgi:phosphatidylglycerophosphatase A